MKSSVIILGAFIAGCIVGRIATTGIDLHTASLYILYALMFQVGISIGCRKDLREIVSQVHPRLLFLPVTTIVGTILFTTLVSGLFKGWSLADCLAVGSGFGYYSLSSILITQLKAPLIGMQRAVELGTISLLANIMREMLSLFLCPLFFKRFGALPAVSAAGVTSMDVSLPALIRCGGQGILPIAITHGVMVDCSVPFIVSFFCGM